MTLLTMLARAVQAQVYRQVCIGQFDHLIAGKLPQTAKLPIAVTQRPSISPKPHEVQRFGTCLLSHTGIGICETDRQLDSTCRSGSMSLRFKQNAPRRDGCKNLIGYGTRMISDFLNGKAIPE